MSVERLLADNYADWLFSTFGIGGGILRYVGRGCLLRLPGECLSPYVRKGRHREEFWGFLVRLRRSAYAKKDEW